MENSTRQKSTINDDFGSFTATNDDSFMIESVDRNPIATGTSESVQPLYFSGYLMKKPESGGDWHRRYFETNGTYLTYYKNSKMKKLLAAVNLLDVVQIDLIGKVESVEGVAFKIRIKDRSYLLAADTQPEAEKWISVLRGLKEGSESAVDKNFQVKNPMITNDTEYLAKSMSASRNNIDANDTEKHEAMLLDKENLMKSKRKVNCKCCLIS